MATAAFLLATRVAVPQQLPGEPPRRTPYDQAVLDHDGASGRPFPEEADHPDPFGHQPPRDAALLPLLAYRGLRFRPVRRRAGLAFVAGAVRPETFNFGESRRDELGRAHDLVHAYGGDAVVLWTWGQAVHVWAARSAGPGARPAVLQLSLRITAPRGGRTQGAAERLCAWLRGSDLAPDAMALQRALAAAPLSLADFFAAFGIPGVEELSPVDPAPVWDAFAQGADALLAGRPADPAARKVVNAAIHDATQHLPAKPATRLGATARRVAAAFAALREELGTPTSPRLAQCAAAAALFDPITSGPAGDALLRTSGKQPALALALGRLLAHYPVALRRDPLFLALAAHEAEAWNGHLYAAAFAELAERARVAGFTAVLVPAAREQAFRKAHGLQADASAARDGWAGEVSIDLAEGPCEGFARWFAKTGADGAVLRCGADGHGELLRFSAGERSRQGVPAQVSDAARALDPRGALLAAGLADVLAPGALAPQERAPQGTGEPVVPRGELEQRLRGEATTVAWPMDRGWPRQDERVALLLRLPAPDPACLAAIVLDARAAWMRGIHAEVAPGGAELWLHTGPRTGQAGQLARLLGDLPAGSRLALVHGAHAAVLRIAEAPEGPYFPPTLVPAEPGWTPPRVLLHAQNIYATADTSRLSWYRAQRQQMAQRLAARYPQRVQAGTEVTPQQALGLHDAALRDIGFAPVGDLLASHLYACALRAYVHADGVTAALVYLLPARPAIECEFRTRLADGADVVTASMNPARPLRAGASRRHVDAPVHGLHESHAMHVAEVRGDRAATGAPKTLEEVARSLET